MELKSDWAKAYVRLGAAEHALGRFEGALNTYKKGLELEPSNKSLLNGIAAAEEAAEKARLAEVERERAERQAYEAAEAARKKMVEEQSENLMEGFFSELESDAERRAEEKREKEAKERRERIQSEKTKKYTEQKLGTSTEQMERLLQRNYKFKNLNPFHVLQLDIDATVEDIKFRYKKLSILTHPDKNQGVPNADEAFEAVKTAYNELLDEKTRQHATDIIDNARASEARDRRRLIGKGMKESDMEPEEFALDKAVMKAFAGACGVLSSCVCVHPTHSACCVTAFVSIFIEACSSL